MELDPDPWNWNVQDVQQFFRNRGAEYTLDMRHARLPPLEPFLAKLHENDVSGAVLLTVIDTATLREDCGVTPLGSRSAIIHCVEKLKRQSATYSARHDIPGPQTPASLSSRAPLPLPEESVLRSLEHASEHGRDDDLDAQEAHVRKRRRLDMTTVQEVSRDEVQVLPAFEATEDIPRNQVQAPLSLIPLDTVSGYLRNAPYLVDKLFYGQTPTGGVIGELETDGDVLVLPADKDAGLDDQNFQFTNQYKSAGEAQFVYSKILHFLTSEEADVVQRHGREARAYFPYREEDALGARSMTVLQFRPGDEEPVAVRENAEHSTGGQTTEVPAGEEAGQWDFLNQKYKPQYDDIVPVLGESDSNVSDESGHTSSGEGAPQAEEDDEDEKHGVLTEEQVIAIIDAFVLEHVDDWKVGLPALEKKRAWSVWKKTKQSRTVRQALIEGAQVQIERYTKRLDLMKSRFLESTWRSEDSLFKVCGSMEPTIDDREEQKWKISVWQRRQEPAHVVRHPAQKPKDAAKTGDSERRESGLHVPLGDRFSVSPAPMDIDDDHPEDELVHETDDNRPQDEILYDGDDDDDDKVFLTPDHSPDTLPVHAFIMPDEDEDEDVLDDGMLDDLPTEAVASEALSSIKDDKLGNDASESDSLPCMSTLVPPGRRTPARPDTLPIDLTKTSSDSSPPPTKRGRGRPRKSPPSARRMKGDPNDATVSDIESWDIGELAEGNDRLRILMKLLSQKPPKFRNRLVDLRRSLGPSTFVDQLQAAARSVRDGTTDAHLRRDVSETMMQLAPIYVHWMVPATMKAGISSLNKIEWNQILTSGQFTNFALMLANVLPKQKHFEKATKSSPSKPGSSSAPIDLHSSETGTGAKKAQTSNRKRKRPVQRSTTAQDARINALERQQRFQESQTTDSAQLVAMLNSDPSYSNIEINPAKQEDDAFIYISDRIARKMKAHQIDGARFLWREITADGEEGGQGCILAHTMGLGKTMQTIAVLVALEEAAQSHDDNVRDQLPPRLRKKNIRGKRNLRTLVLCPPGLIQNWEHEIGQWASTQLGQVTVVDNSTQEQCLQRLKEWMRVGGVLLVGYQKFRSLLKTKPSKGEPPDLKAEALEKFEKRLLNGPDIVVADEAHHLKNKDAAVSAAASRIETESRIALTGTPMSNDVDEMYALVTWAAPGFLGDPKEFTGHYATPIKEGLFSDSTAYQKRKSLMKLKVLQAEIEPKVNRANIEVLRGSLKPKIEFVITIPLREVQLRLYSRYIKALINRDRSEKAGQMLVFSWLNVLTLLVNHPRCFRRRLLEGPTGRKRKKAVPLHDAAEQEDSPDAIASGANTPQLPGGIDANGDDVESPDEPKDGTDNESVDGIVPDFESAEIDEILNGFQDTIEPHMSAKFTVFLSLLDYSLECNDKVLVFTGSIPTMDYISELFNHQGRKFERIQGGVSTKKRMEILEAFAADQFQILLISTKAGGVGLNIQSANRVFILDFKFNPTVEEQAIGRAYRLGQPKPVYVYRFVTGGTFEQNLYDQNLFKSSLAQRVVDKKNPRRNAKRDAREYLYEPKEVPQANVAREIGKDPLVLDRLLKQHLPGGTSMTESLIKSITTMETLQEEVKDDVLNEEEQLAVSEEIAQRRLRGRRAAAADAMGPPALPASTAPQAGGQRSAMVHFPVPSAFMQNYPSTMVAPSAGPSALQPHPLGGLPSMSSAYQGQ